MDNDTNRSKANSVDAIKNIYNSRVNSVDSSNGGKYGKADIRVGTATPKEKGVYINERETPIGTIGYGKGNGGMDAFYEPSQPIQDTYSKFLQMISQLRR